MRKIPYPGLMVLALILLAACAPSDTGGTNQVEAKAEAEAPAPSTPEAPPEALSADEVLRRMSDHIASMDSFRISATIEYDDVPVPDVKVEYSGDVEIELARPDRLRVDYRDDLEAKRLWIADGEVTLFDPEQNVYGTVPAQADIDATLDSLYDNEGVAVPLDDVLVSDPYGQMSANVEESKYLGIHEVRGVPCHHAVFDSGDIGWQIWVEVGETPRLRKVVITYPDEPMAPRYSIDIESLEPTTPDDAAFRADVPEDAMRAEFETVTIEEES